LSLYATHNPTSSLCLDNAELVSLTGSRLRKIARVIRHFGVDGSRASSLAGIDLVRTSRGEIQWGMSSEAFTLHVV